MNNRNNKNNSGHNGNGFRKNSGNYDRNNRRRGNSRIEADHSKLFVNPYNFVSFPDKIDRREYRRSVGELSGYIDCTLELKTPMAIPDTDTAVEVSGHAKEYSFYKIAGNPVIPGSSLRGCIRGIYETVTDSCVSKTYDGELSYRSAEVGKPGLLRWNGESWLLVPAVKYRVRFNKKEPHVIVQGDNEFRNLEEVRFNLDKFGAACNLRKANDDCNINGLKGILLLWNDIFKKKSQSIFVEDKKNRDVIVLKNDKDGRNRYIERLNRLVEIYKENDRKNLLHIDDFNYKVKAGDKDIPVWYREVEDGEEESIYLSPACISRWVNEKSIADYLREADACRERSEVCPACAMFGFAGKGDSGQNGASGGKVSVSDARLMGTASYVDGGNKVLLKELASPHISSMEFYTSFFDDYDGVKTANYDYLTFGKNDFMFVDPEHNMLNGRKYYWHNFRNDAFRGRDDNERCSKMQLLDKGNRFTFRVTFDRLTRESLGELLWCITLSDNRSDSRFCQKLGHGKSIGLGSIKITADRCVTRTFANEEYRLDNLNIAELIAEADNFLAGKSQVRELKTISDTTFLDKLPPGAKISYPPGYQGDGNSFEWFVGNRGGMGKTVGVKQTLPLLKYCKNPEDFVMYGYKKVQQQ